MAHFVLVHGSFHGAWCWERLVPLLHERNHEARCPELPGHGADPTPPDQVSLASCICRVCDAMTACPEPPIVVAHSLSGVVLTPVAARNPDALRAAVYVTAFLPPPGQSAFDYSGGGQQSLARRYVRRSADGHTLELPTEIVPKAFYGECDAATVEWATARFRPDPLGPNVEPVDYDARALARARKFYVECTRDRAITVDMQRDMRSHSTFAGVYSLPADHSPMLSYPEELASVLGELAKR